MLNFGFDPDGYTIETLTSADMADRSLYYDILLYSGLTATPEEATDPLDKRGGEVDSIISGVISEILPDIPISIGIENIGIDPGEFEAAVICLSLFPDEPPDEHTPYNALPLPYSYSYELVAEPLAVASSPITTSTTWTADSLLALDGPLVIENSATLTLDEGVHLYMMSEDASIRLKDSASIVATGTASNPVVFQPLHQDSVLFSWRGIFADTSSVDIELTHCLVSALDSLIKSPSGTFEADHVTLDMSPDALNVVTLRGDSLIAWSRLTDTQFISANSIRAEHADFSGCILEQSPAVRELSKSPPLLTFTAGSNEMDSTIIRYVKTGVRVMGDSPGTTYLDPVVDVEVRGLDPAQDPKSIGMQCLEGSFVVADSFLHIADSNTCVEVDDGRFYMRKSTLEVIGLGLDGKGSQAVVNLGSEITPGMNTIKNPVLDCKMPYGAPECLGEPLPNLKTRILYMSGVNACYAKSNDWGVCMCDLTFFQGKTRFIYWQPFLFDSQACCDTGGIGGGQSSLIAGDTNEIESIRIHPNPALGEVTIGLPARRTQASVIIDIYSVSGRHVRSMRHVAEGPQRVTWDGTDGNGRHVSSGVYFARIYMDSRAVSRKFVLLR